MNRKELAKQLAEAGVEVKEGKIKKSDIKAFLTTAETDEDDDGYGYDFTNMETWQIYCKKNGATWFSLEEGVIKAYSNRGEVVGIWERNNTGAVGKF